MLVEFAEVILAFTPPIYTMFSEVFEPKFDPEIVTDVPGVPAAGEKS